MESINHMTIDGNAIQVTLCDLDPSTQKHSSGNLFVKNLHESIDKKELEEIFSPVGNIFSCKVSMQEEKSRGYGFVQFQKDEAAKLAIEKFNGIVIKGKKLHVEKYIRKSERGAEVKFTNLFVKNIDLDITEKILCERFAEFGKITSTIIMKDEDSKSKGFGFINFESPDWAKKAVEALNGALLGSKSIFVGRAQKRTERKQMLRRQYEEMRLERIQKSQGSNLYVKHLNDIIDDEYLRGLFSWHGNIVSAKVMRNEKGLSKGFGFVCFSSPEEATRALEKRGSMVFGKPIYVAVAQRKEKRRAHLEQLYAQRMAGFSGTNIMPAPYAPMYYNTAPSAMVPTQGSGYPMGVRPAGTAGTPSFQPMPPALPVVPAGPWQRRQMRGLAIGQPSEAMVNERQRQMNGAQAPAVLPASVHPADWSSTQLASAGAREQKQMLGELLFPLVQELQFNLAGKITGMLLEMDNAELLQLLESPEALASKVEEAVLVLQEHRKASLDAQGPLASAATQQSRSR